MTRRKTNEEFVSEVKSLVGDEYVFLDEYQNSQTKLRVVHNKCKNTYSVTPSNFKAGYRCPFCSKRPRWDTEKMKLFLKEHHPNLIMLDEYVDNHTKIRFLCTNCGEISLSRPGNKKIGHGCIKCAGVKPYTLDEIKKKVRELTDGEYEYLDNTYVNTHHHHTIKHLKCGNVWKPELSLFLSGTRCPKCASIYNSKGVKRIKKFLEENTIEYLTEYKIDNLVSPFSGEPLRFDFYLPKQNLYIEYDGEQHFVPFRYSNGLEKFERTQKLDKHKNEFCKVNGLELIRIKYTDIDLIDNILSEKLLVN